MFSIKVSFDKIEHFQKRVFRFVLDNYTSFYMN